MKKTFNDLFILDQFVGSLLKENAELINTKFGIAYKKHLDKNYSPLIENRKDGINDIYLEHALTDATTGAVLFDKESDFGYKFSKEGFKKSQEDVKEWVKKFGVTEYECEAIACKELPKSFDKTPVKEIVEGLFV